MEKELGLERTFLTTLVEDAADSLERANDSNSASARRDVIRTIFAAVEGALWWYREYLIEALEELDQTDPVLSLALSEKSYRIDEQGKITEQVRFLPILSMIRLAARTGEILTEDWQADFAGKGWEDLIKTITVRNRVTHPKSATDLIVSQDEIDAASNSIFWFLDLVFSSMEQANEIRRARYKELKQFLDVARKDLS